jgi:hypothetical protein
VLQHSYCRMVKVSLRSGDVSTYPEAPMNAYRTAIYSVATSLAFVGFASGQTSPPSDATSPSAASSPHQRDATSGHHQTGKTEAQQTIKACIIREQADHTGMSMAEAKKSCKEQLKPTPSK